MMTLPAEERSSFVPHYERTTKGSTYVVPSERGTSGDGSLHGSFRGIGVPPVSLDNAPLAVGSRRGLRARRPCHVSGLISVFSCSFKSEPLTCHSPGNDAVTPRQILEHRSPLKPLPLEQINHLRPLLIANL
jgi:hypothetical protein